MLKPKLAGIRIFPESPLGIGFCLPHSRLIWHLLEGRDDICGHKALLCAPTSWRRSVILWARPAMLPGKPNKRHGGVFSLNHPSVTLA